jgi:hypothetical protein
MKTTTWDKKRRMPRVAKRKEVVTCPVCGEVKVK